MIGNLCNLSLSTGSGRMVLKNCPRYYLHLLQSSDFRSFNLLVLIRGFSLYYIWRKKLCNDNFSFLPMPLVSGVKDQFKLPKSLLVGGQCLNRVMFCLKPIDFNGFSI